jgi:hypothetical protein
MANVAKVQALVLNVRSVPSAINNTPLLTLAQGTLVNLTGAEQDGWAPISVSLNGGQTSGFVAARFLEAVNDPSSTAPAALAPAVQIAPAHLAQDNRNAARANTNSRAYPLFEPPMPRRGEGLSASQRRAALKEIADWLDVERSARYQPTALTFCNIYATDYCYLAGVYLPRVWWTEKALLAIAQGQTPAAQYDQTVRELKADDLHQWLLEHGTDYGWRRVFDAGALQAAADDGGIGVICADREQDGRSGHICVVVPQGDGHAAHVGAGGQIDLPLQSQAGSSNYRYRSSGAQWWLGDQFRSYVFFVHD